MGLNICGNAQNKVHVLMWFCGLIFAVSITTMMISSMPVKQVIPIMC